MSGASPPQGASAADPDQRWGWLVRATVAVLARPALWGTAARQVWVMAVPGWWRSAPYLPLPDAAYLRFRLQTAYGDPDQNPSPADVVTYLHWCRSWPRLTR